MAGQRGREPPHLAIQLATVPAVERARARCRLPCDVATVCIRSCEHCSANACLAALLGLTTPARQLLSPTLLRLLRRPEFLQLHRRRRQGREQCPLPFREQRLDLSFRPPRAKLVEQ